MCGGSAEIESQSFCEGNEGIAASSLATTGRFLPGNDRASFSSFPPSTSVMMSLHDESASLYAAGSLSFGRRRHGRKGGGRGRRERERVDRVVKAFAFTSRSSPPSPESSSIHSLLHDLLGLVSRAIPYR